MGIEERVETQLEFPFLNDVRLKSYIQAQRAEMLALYNVNYRRDGDYGKEPFMRFGDFIAEVWIKEGHAQEFREKNHKKYFYDVPREIGQTAQPLYGITRPR